jgi:hypothetical protein
MPLGPRRTHRSAIRRPRRRTTWADTGIITGAGVPAGQQQIIDLLAQLTPSTLALQEAGMTVRRTIITGAFSPTAVGDVFHVALAVLRRSDLSAATPNLSPIDIATESWAIDWCWNDTYFATTSGATVDAALPFRIDTRVMRRLTDPGLRYAAVVSNPNATARSWSYRARVLVALP